MLGELNSEIKKIGANSQGSDILNKERRIMCNKLLQKLEQTMMIPKIVITEKDTEESRVETIDATLKKYNKMAEELNTEVKDVYSKENWKTNSMTNEKLILCEKLLLDLEKNLSIVPGQKLIQEINTSESLIIKPEKISITHHIKNMLLYPLELIGRIPEFIKSLWGEPDDGYLAPIFDMFLYFWRFILIIIGITILYCVHLCLSGFGV